MKEENNLVSRVKRYSQVTTSLTSLATKFAGKKYLNFERFDALLIPSQILLLY